MSNHIEFTLNLNPERDLTISFADIQEFLIKKDYPCYILSREEGSDGGKEHFHLYVKCDQQPKNFKKSFCRYFKLEDTTKLECRCGQVKFVNKWIGYIAKDGNFVFKGISKDEIDSHRKSYQESNDKKLYKTSSRQTFLYTVRQNYRKFKGYKRFHWDHDQLSFLAVRDTLLISKILPPGLKLADYTKIILNWEAPDRVDPFVVTIIGRLLGQKSLDLEREDVVVFHEPTFVDLHRTDIRWLLDHPSGDDPSGRSWAEPRLEP